MDTELTNLIPNLSLIFIQYIPTDVIALIPNMHFFSAVYLEAIRNTKLSTCIFIRKSPGFLCSTERIEKGISHQDFTDHWVVSGPNFC